MNKICSVDKGTRALLACPGMLLAGVSTDLRAAYLLRAELESKDRVGNATFQFFVVHDK